ncbi:MAG: caspase family protein [Caldilineaceae bacterium]|nr:caspase family protein [Caldilineaceae bacterium]
MTERTIYALLVGIDRYPKPVTPLRGCVSDVRHMEAFLKARLGPGERLAPLLVTDEQATRQGIIDAFRGHLRQAGPADVALFYYSGHGSQAPTPPELWHLEPDHLDETLVCFDSRLPGHYDLADKELAQLIAEVAERGAHVAVILDCCHSGSGTRAPEEEDVSVRRVPADDRLRPLETYLLAPDQAAAYSPSTRGAGGSGWYELPQGRHILLAACRADEEAKELMLGGERRGAFSYYLQQSLQVASGPLTYRDLFKRSDALVRMRVSRQTPQIEAIDPRDLDQPFLGGSVGTRPDYYTVTYESEQGWLLDGGAIHGFPQPAGEETTWLALYAFDAPAGHLGDLSRAIGEARIMKVLPGHSTLELRLPGDRQPDTGQTFKAVVKALPLAPLAVALEGDGAATGLLRRALSAAGPDGGPSLLVREAAPDSAELVVECSDAGYRIRRQADQYTLVVETPGVGAESAELTKDRLEHMARWQRTMELENPASRIPAQAIQLDLLTADPQGEWRPLRVSQAVELHYVPSQSGWQSPAFRLRIRNNGEQTLYCNVLDLTQHFGADLLFGAGSLRLQPGEEAWGLDGRTIRSEVPDDFWQAGVMEYRDSLKLIVSTEPFEGDLLRLDDLPVQIIARRAERPASPNNALERLMARVGHRRLKADPDPNESLNDWTTQTLTLTTVRPLEAVPIGSPGSRAGLGYGVTVMGHSQLQARARLTQLEEGSRDAGASLAPPLLRDRPGLAEPLTFASSRGSAPGLNVLELLDVADYTAVNADSPLLVEIDTALAADEHVLPVGFDGEFYLPLGRAQRSEGGVAVTLERLPAPTGTRDLKGSIKILFQKFRGQYLGTTFDYPRLAIVDFASSPPAYIRDPAIVRKRLAAARRILLFTHGIIGSTDAMVIAAQPHRLPQPLPLPHLEDRYDVVLAFDYESINTAIEDNARALKQQLTDVGLGPDHGKTLHVVAHSMGGLLCRWFIEHEGGNKIAQRLVMIGTPNAGSPWPTVQDWATAALGLALNGLGGVGWPGQIIGALVGALETVDVALDQMRSGSDLLRSLAAGVDPGVPYHVIAGNTGLIEPAVARPSQGEPSLVERLWGVLSPKRWFHAGLSAAFFFAPNDIAVSVESIRSLPSDRTPPPAIRELACDHVSYFFTLASVQALIDALDAP